MARQTTLVGTALALAASTGVPAAGLLVVLVVAFGFSVATAHAVDVGLETNLHALAAVADFLVAFGLTPVSLDVPPGCLRLLRRVLTVPT